MKRNRAGQYRAGRHQAGLTLIGFVIVLAVVGLFVYVGMKLVPMYTEYYSVKQALKGLAGEPGIAQQDPGRIRELFFRRLNMSYAQNVKSEHVKLERTEDGMGWNMTVDYELRRPMIANLDVVGKFNASQALTSRGADD